jgi:hypothetical protein
MYPITYEADYKREPSRVKSFFRFILVIPWLIVAYVYIIAAIFTLLAAWVAIIITGRYPEGLYNFNSGVLRYFTRVNSFEFLLTDEYPPFGLRPDPTYPVRLEIAPRPESQSRLSAHFRLILAIPQFILGYGINFLHLGAVVVSWLTIVFRGYQPAGVHNALTFTTAWQARVGGYIALLTDAYPPDGDEGVQVGDVRPSAPAAPAQPEPPAAPPAEGQ